MKQTTPSLEYYGQYPNIFRSQVRQLLMWGYQDALNKIRFRDKKHHQEPAITGFIVAAINNRRRAKSRPKWLRHYTVHDDPPVEAENKSGRERPRVDIIIEASSWKGCPEYMIEAKRLRKNGYGVNKYVGSEGMGCFVRGLYAERYDEAVMLGYVQSDSLDYWKAKIRGEIEAQTPQLQLKSPQAEAQFLNACPLEWTSEHYRTHLGRSILIFHILLDCRLVG